MFGGGGGVGCGLAAVVAADPLGVSLPGAAASAAPSVSVPPELPTDPDPAPGVPLTLRGAPATGLVPPSNDEPEQATNATIAVTNAAPCSVLMGQISLIAWKLDSPTLKGLIGQVGTGLEQKVPNFEFPISYPGLASGGGSAIEWPTSRPL